jgi:hypothetical protein
MKMRRVWPTHFFPCLVCGVDSKPVLTTFIVLVGSGLLISASLLITGLRRGWFQNRKSMELLPAEIESAATQKPETL